MTSEASLPAEKEGNRELNSACNLWYQEFLGPPVHLPPDGAPAAPRKHWLKVKAELNSGRWWLCKYNKKALFLGGNYFSYLRLALSPSSQLLCVLYKFAISIKDTKFDNNAPFKVHPYTNIISIPRLSRNVWLSGKERRRCQSQHGKNGK